MYTYENDNGNKFTMVYLVWLDDGVDNAIIKSIHLDAFEAKQEAKKYEGIEGLKVWVMESDTQIG